MELEKYFEGLQWKVYNEYIVENFEGYDFIVPVFTKGVKDTYNPNINEEKDPPTKRNTLFNQFAMIDTDTGSILKIVKQYGLLWTSSRRKHQPRGDLLEKTKEEIHVLKTAREIYMALRKNNVVKLKELIKLDKYSDYMSKFYKVDYVDIEKDADLSNISSKDITFKRSVLDNKESDDFVVRVGVKNEPLLVITVEKNNKEDLEVIRFAAFYYLAELISDRIKINGGAFPYFIKINRSENNETGFSAVTLLESKNLASSLWIQFYNAITIFQDYKICKNCGNIFGRDERERLRDFCSLKCKKAKNYRTPKKNKHTN